MRRAAGYREIDIKLLSETTQMHGLVTRGWLGRGRLRDRLDSKAIVP